jgi:hypothetical protein
MRRRLISTLVLLALVAAACGKDAKQAEGVAHAKGPEDVVLRIENKGGFVPPDARLTEIPTVSLFGDGRFVTLGPQIEIYPSPALPNFITRTIREPGIQAILAAAREAGLMAGNKRLDNPMVADAATTVFTVKAGGQQHVVEAVALGDSPPGAGGNDPALRKNLLEFQNLLTDLGRWLPKGSVSEEKQYVASGVRILAQPYVKSDEGPAQQPIAWPGAEALAKFGNARPEGPNLRCGVLRGDDLRKVLALASRANQLTPWRSDGKDYQVRFRPLLPDESGC